MLFYISYPGHAAVTLDPLFIIDVGIGVPIKVNGEAVEAVLAINPSLVAFITKSK